MTHYVFIDSKGVKPLERSQIKDGDVVAFVSEYGRGVALMQDGNWFYSAYNLYRQNEVWVSDNMPEEIQLLPPTKDDMLLAIDHLYADDGDDHPEDVLLWPNSLHGMDASVRQAMDNLHQALKEQNEMQDHIVKRWQKKRDEEIEKAEEIRYQWEKETEEHCEHIEQLEKKVKEDEAHIKQLEAEIERLKQQPSEDNFVRRLVKETKNLYKHEKAKTEVIRQILYKVGRSDAEAELDAWIEGKEVRKAIHVEGDYVLEKNVEHQVEHVAAGGTGISVNGKEKKK